MNYKGFKVKCNIGKLRKQTKREEADIKDSLIKAISYYLEMFDKVPEKGLKFKTGTTSAATFDYMVFDGENNEMIFYFEPYFGL